MFINCPYCNAFIATDPGTGALPALCPFCECQLELTAPPDPTQEARDTVATVDIDPPQAEAEVVADDLHDYAIASELEPSTRTDAPEQAISEQAAPEQTIPAHKENWLTAMLRTLLGPRKVNVVTSPEAASDAQVEFAPEEQTLETGVADDALTDPAEELHGELALEEPASEEPASEIEEHNTDEVEFDQATVGELEIVDVPVAAFESPVNEAGEPDELAPTSIDAEFHTAKPSTPKRARPAPSFAPRISKRHSAAQVGVGLWLAIAGLSALLGLQILLADRDRLAADAQWRPLLTSLCGALQCALPAWREPSAFSMQDRAVRAHPVVAGALAVGVTFRNDARWPQPWPTLLLSLSNVDGRVVGSRAFTPAEYLGTLPQSELAPGQSAQIALEVREPAPNVVAFQFEFR